MGVLPLAYLIPALVASAIAGGLLVWLIGYISGGGKGALIGHERPPTAVVPAEPETPVPAGKQELLRVSRTEKGKLVVFVQGRRCHYLREVRDPQVGRETIEALKTVLAFAEGWLPTLRQESPQPAPGKSSVDEEAFLEKLRQSDLFPLDEPSGSLGRLRPHASPLPLKPLLTPADQINDLVQQRLGERPDLVKHNIRLTTGEDGGLRIHMGLQTFAAIDDVPDPEVRALIHDAIREWESD